MTNASEKVGSDEMPSTARSRTRSQSVTPRFIDSYEWIEFKPTGKSQHDVSKEKLESEEDFIDISDLGVLCLSIDANDELEESVHSLRKQETPCKDEKNALLHKLFPKIADATVATSEDPHRLKRSMSLSTRILHNSPSSLSEVAKFDYNNEQGMKQVKNELDLPYALTIEHTSSYDLENSSYSEDEKENQSGNAAEEEEEVVELPMAILMPQHRNQAVNRSRSFERRKAQGNWPPLSVTDRVPEVILQPSELLMQHQQHHSPKAPVARKEG